MVQAILRTTKRTLEKRWFEILIDYSLVLYAILLPLEIILAGNQLVGTGIITIQRILIAEMAVRVVLTISRTTKEEKEGWFWFDLATTLASFVPGYGALRALRVLRLVGRWEYFKIHVEEMLLKSAKAIPLLLLAALITYVHGVIIFKEYHLVIDDMLTFGDSILTASFLILFDGPRATYGAMFEHNVVIALISMTLTFLVSLIVISQILKVVIDSDDDPEKDALKAEVARLRQELASTKV